MAAPVRSGASFEPGTPRTLFSGDGVTPPLQMNSYDVSRDGRRFVMVQQVEAGEQPASVVTLVQDWVEGRLTP